MLTNRSAPPATVTPVLFYPDVRAAVAWLDDAFAFGERVRIGESHRAQLRVGDDGAVVVAEAHRDKVAPQGSDAAAHVIKVRVPDVDAAFARARDAGASVLQEPKTWAYGERSCVVGDLAGHHWELTQTVRDVAPEEWGGESVAPW
ncbi:MAG TPA: VOC family protein [Gaiellaceae bacterium]